MVIYKITQRSGTKVYIGRTTQTLQARWQWHKWCAQHETSTQRFHEALREHGPEAFDIEIIATAQSKKELIELEKEYILSYHSNEPEFGYNVRIGNGGALYTGHKHSAELKERFSRERKGSGNPAYGTRRTAESREKMRRARLSYFSQDENRRSLSLRNSALATNADHIRELLASGSTQREIARQFGVSETSVSRFVLNKLIWQQPTN